MRKFINNLKISHVLIIMSALTVIIIIGQTYSGKVNIDKSRDFIQKLEHEKIEPVILLFSISSEYSINIIEESNRAHHYASSWEEASETISTARKNADELWDAYAAIINDNGETNQLLAVRSLRQKADIVLDKLENILADRDELALENLIIHDLHPAIDPITDIIQSIVKKHQESIQQIADDSDTLYQTSFSRARFFGITAILTIISLAIFVILTIKKSLRRANECIKKISEGDLLVEIEGGDDEIGELLSNIKILVKNLRVILENIHTSANNIAVTSHQLSSNSQQISQGATEQAASVEEMAASMEEISANVIQNAKNANVTEQISEQAGSEFENGRENIDTTVEAIQTIASKISIIGEIAFQTNILALNAAVEAARAGEHGKGFGVVAAEVGKLAERSKIAAAEIDTLSKSGVELSLKSKNLLKVALPSINKTIKLVKEIRLTSSDQSSGIDQINTGIQTLNHVTQQNAASSEEMATVAEEMAAQAEQLSNSIRFFKIGEKNKEKAKNTNSATKYIEHKEPLKDNKKEERKGIELDLNSQDDLDSEFETF